MAFINGQIAWGDAYAPLGDDGSPDIEGMFSRGKQAMDWLKMHDPALYSHFASNLGEGMKWLDAGYRGVGNSQQGFGGQRHGRHGNLMFGKADNYSRAFDDIYNLIGGEDVIKGRRKYNLREVIGKGPKFNPASIRFNPFDEAHYANQGFQDYRGARVSLDPTLMKNYKAKQAEEFRLDQAMPWRHTIKSVAANNPTASFFGQAPGMSVKKTSYNKIGEAIS